MSSLHGGSKYEYVRYRKTKDKDKEKDRRSSTASSIIVRKSNKVGSAGETTSHGQSDTQSIATIEQLPPLPESESTSPILRTSSNASHGSRVSPSQVQTPASLQPYLESDAGESDVGDSVLEGSREWIGPPPGSSPPPAETSEAVTPKATRTAFLPPLGRRSSKASSRDKRHSKSGEGEDDEISHRCRCLLQQPVSSI